MSTDESTPDRPAKPIDYSAAKRLVADVFAPDSEDDPARPNTGFPSVPDYTISAHLGSGGGGDVYLAVRRGSDYPVALKVFRHAVANGDAVARIRREIETLSKTRLECVPRVLDHGLADDRLFVATEYVDGSPIDRFCNEGDLRLRERVEILSSVCDAVQRLHDRGVLHRDIKPSNVLIDERDQVHIIDLGIAKMIKSDPSLTLTKDDSPIGSPLYMSPEQARGDREAVTIQSDVFALGAMGYSLLLGGVTPYEPSSNTARMLQRVSNEQPRDPRALNGDIPKPLANVLAKAVASRVEDRYRTADELARDLRRWLAGEPVDAGAWNMRRRITRWVTRHTVASASIVAALILGSSIVASVLTVHIALRRPYQIVLSDDRSTATLVSRAGNPLFEWRTGAIGGVQNAFLLDGRVNTGRFAVIGFSRASQIKAGQLCVFDLSKPIDVPIWHDAIGHRDLPVEADHTKVSADGFGVGRVLNAFDVFGDESSELVVSFSHPESTTVVRIYDPADGTILYEVWHEGVFQDAVWDRASRHLFLSGYNTLAYWGDRAIQVEGTLSRHPRVVCAVKPRLDRTSRRWLSEATGDAQNAAVWYLCLRPPRIAENVALRVVAPQPTDPAAVAVKVNLNVGSSDKTVQLWLDAYGDEVEPRSMNNPYRVAFDAGEVPAPAAYHLGVLPPLKQHGPEN